MTTSAPSQPASSSAAGDAPTAARRALDALLTSKQLVLVTGKGGVGKSAVSAALALRARALGLRPVLFECDAPERPSALPGGRTAGPAISEVAPGILGINQRSDDAIREYAASTLPSRALADLLFENRIARLFLKAAPSVGEMALVGRMAWLADKHGADGPVIVDLHATGHALSLLRAPRGIMSVLRTGPLFDRAAAIERLLQDPVRTAFVTVALPEELPVTELCELYTRLAEHKAPPGVTVLNGVFGDPTPLITDDVAAHLARDGVVATVKRAADDLRVLRAWSKRAAREQARLAPAAAAAGWPVLPLPFLLRGTDNSDSTLAGMLADVLAGKAPAAGGGVP